MSYGGRSQERGNGFRTKCPQSRDNHGNGHTPSIVNHERAIRRPTTELTGPQLADAKKCFQNAVNVLAARQWIITQIEPLRLGMSKVSVMPPPDLVEILPEQGNGTKYVWQLVYYPQNYSGKMYPSNGQEYLPIYFSIQRDDLPMLAEIYAQCAILCGFGKYVFLLLEDPNTDHTKLQDFCDNHLECGAWKLLENQSWFLQTKCLDHLQRLWTHIKKQRIAQAHSIPAMLSLDNR